MPFENKMPAPVLKRMPAYYRFLSKLIQLGINRISSKDLANAMEITPSQIRQDFFSFSANGLQGYGYDVKYLYQEISHVLGLNNLRKFIVVGSGGLGQALAKNTKFAKYGFQIVGIFDVNPQLIGEKISGIEICHMDGLPDFLQNNHVDIAAITVPEAYAYEVVSLLTGLGIKGIWNFAPVELKVPPDVVIEHIHLSDSLMILGYRLTESEKNLNPDDATQQ